MLALQNDDASVFRWFIEILLAGIQMTGGRAPGPVQKTSITTCEEAQSVLRLEAFFPYTRHKASKRHEKSLYNIKHTVRPEHSIHLCTLVYNVYTFLIYYCNWSWGCLFPSPTMVVTTRIIYTWGSQPEPSITQWKSAGPLAMLNLQRTVSKNGKK